MYPHLTWETGKNVNLAPVTLSGLLFVTELTDLALSSNGVKMLSLYSESLDFSEPKSVS